MHGEYKTPGGKLVIVDFDVESDRLTNVEVSGDFFLEPAEALTTITTAVENLPVDSTEEQIATAIRAALSPEVEMIGFSPEAVAHAVRRALR